MSQCERDSLCVRGFRHLGGGGRCSYRNSPSAGELRTKMSAESEGSYSVAVHGRCMIAHSFKGECFGPAQALHGCTYVVDAIVEGPKLQTGANYLVDICLAERAFT